MPDIAGLEEYIEAQPIVDKFLGPDGSVYTLGSGSYSPGPDWPAILAALAQQTLVVG